MKKTGTLQMDVDELWVLYKYLNNVTNYNITNVYQGLPFLLDLLDEHDFRMTFFVVGMDCLHKEKARVLEEVHRRGHEIANHSMSHPVGIADLPEKIKIRELKEAEDAISQVTQVRPVGYRSPGYSIGPEMMDALEERNYLYDSSVFPSSLIGLQKLLCWLFWKEKSQHIYGPLSTIFAPLKIYHPDQKRIWKRGSRKIYEVPVSVLPLCRLPFHAVFPIGYGNFIFDWGFALFNRSSATFNYLFHGIEVADHIDKNLIPRIYRANKSLRRRRELYRHIMKSIATVYQIVTTKELVESHSG